VVIEPIFGVPALLEMVNFPIRVRFRKVLSVGRPEIMVALNRKDIYI
jgi:hypothetical protein